VDLARERTQAERDRVYAECGGQIEFHAGDMLDPAHGRFDHIVCMDSIIHYGHADVQRVLACLVERTQASVVFTFAPRTPLLALMHRVGSLFPRGDRAPMIVPVAEAQLQRTVQEDPRFAQWCAPRTQRIQAGFYISQAMELQRR